MSANFRKNNQGFTVFFTGLSASGKTTTAETVISKLTKIGRVVTFLDGDVVRKNISSKLGFSKEDRIFQVNLVFRKKTEF